MIKKLLLTLVFSLAFFGPSITHAATFEMEENPLTVEDTTWDFDITSGVGEKTCLFEPNGDLSTGPITNSGESYNFPSDDQTWNATFGGGTGVWTIMSTEDADCGSTLGATGIIKRWSIFVGVVPSQYVDPLTYESGATEFVIDVPDGTDIGYILYKPDGTLADLAAGDASFIASDLFGEDLGTFHLIVPNDAALIFASECETYAECLTYLDVALVSDFTITYTGSSGISGIITSASTTLSETLGFGLGDIQDLMKTNMLLVAGSGLGILNQIWGFLLAVAFIWVMVSFIWAGFKYFYQDRY